MLRLQRFRNILLLALVLLAVSILAEDKKGDDDGVFSDLEDKDGDKEDADKESGDDDKESSDDEENTDTDESVAPMQGGGENNNPGEDGTGPTDGSDTEQIDPEDAFVWPTTEEEQRADVLPVEHNCNGCKGVAYQIDAALKALMPKDAPRRALAEHEYTEAMECRPSVYDRYGLKKLEDRTRVLVGPGLPFWQDKEGSIFEGSRWPGRMARHCGKIVGDFDDEEAEVYKMWLDTVKDEGYDDFSEALCGPMCGKPRKKKAAPTTTTEKPAPKKKAPKKKEEPMDGPPQTMNIYEKKELVKLVNKKYKMVFLLFCAPTFKRCKDLEHEFEKAARAAKKDKAMKKDVLFAKANTDQVGTFEFEVDRDILPAFLLFRKGYEAPKGVSPEDMLKLKESGDFLNFIQEELGQYMQDDPGNFPRGKLEL